MDEVKTMTRAGETVNKAVAAGLDVVRRAGHAGAEATTRAAHAAEQKLTEHGIAPQQLTEALVESAQVAREEVAKTTRRTRRKLAKTAKHTRKELAKAAKQARKSKPAKIAKTDARQAKEQAKIMKSGLMADAAEFKARTKEGAKALTATKGELKAQLKAAKEAAKASGKAKRRRRWPLLVIIAVVGAGVAYARRSKPEPAPEVPRQATPADEPAKQQDTAKADIEKTSAKTTNSARNGQSTPSKPATKRT